jgi:hypothetical protein
LRLSQSNPFSTIILWDRWFHLRYISSKMKIWLRGQSLRHESSLSINVYAILFVNIVRCPHMGSICWSFADPWIYQQIF